MTDNTHNSMAVGKHYEPANMTHWEQASISRWGSYITRIEERFILQAALMAGTPSKALEIGCEGGRWSKMLSDAGWQMTCIDVNPKTLAVCQQRVPEAKCILSSPNDEKIPSEPDSVNLLLCVEVAPVINSHWFLAEAHRVLGQNGILVGVCWNRNSLRNLFSRIKTLGGSATVTNNYAHSYSVWRQALRRAGFELVREEGFCWGFFRRFSNSPLVPLVTKLERLLQLHRLTVLSPWIVFIARKKDSKLLAKREM